MGVHRLKVIEINIARETNLTQISILSSFCFLEPNLEIFASFATNDNVGWCLMKFVVIVDQVKGIHLANDWAFKVLWTKSFILNWVYKLNLSFVAEIVFILVAFASRWWCWPTTRSITSQTLWPCWARSRCSFSILLAFILRIRSWPRSLIWLLVRRRHLSRWR